MSPILAHVCEVAGVTDYCLLGGRAIFAVCLELSILVDHQLINLIAPVT